MNKKINFFLGGGAARSVWQLGFVKTIMDKKISNGEFQVNNISAVSAGNYIGLGIAYNEHELLSSYYKKYDEKTPTFCKVDRKNLFDPFYTWENSASHTFVRDFFTKVENKKITCDFNSGVFNLKKLKTEWLPLWDKNPLEIERIIFASCSIPILFSMKSINDQLYIDAGMFEYFLIQDFMKKYENEINIILTSVDYGLKTKPYSLAFSIPEDVKQIVGFMESKQENLTKGYELSVKHGEDVFYKIEKVLSQFF